MRWALWLTALFSFPGVALAQNLGEQLASIDVGQNARLILERNAAEPLLADVIGIIKRRDGSLSMVRSPEIGHANSLDETPAITPMPNERYMLGNFGCGPCGNHRQGSNFIVGILDGTWYVTGYVEEHRNPTKGWEMVCDVNLEARTATMTANGKVTTSLTDEVPFPLADLRRNFVPKACVFPEPRPRQRLIIE